MGYAILGMLLLVAVIGWAREWFANRVLVAYLTKKKISIPPEEEWIELSKIVLRHLFRK